MKPLLLFACLCFTAIFCKAQYVTIPDPNFVTYLQDTFPGCMNGNQMDTTCSAITGATQVNCINASISDLTGIEYFDSLLGLNCKQNSLSALPPLPSSLTHLFCSENNITNLNLLPSMITVDCSNNPISSLPALPSTLKMLVCYNNELTALPLLPSGLHHLNCGANQISSLPALPATLTYLRCENNLLTTVPTLPSVLNTLNCRNNDLSSLPSLPLNLQQLACGENQLTALPTQISQLSNLDLLSCSSNHLATLPPLPPALVYLYCSDNPLTGIPSLPVTLKDLNCSSTLVSSLPELPATIERLWCNGTPNLHCLPNLQQLQYLSYNPSYIPCLPNFGAIQQSSPSIDNAVLCDEWNTNGCQAFWNVTGAVYKDDNNNCLKEATDAGISLLKLNLRQGATVIRQTLTTSFGNYSFDTGLDTYEIYIDTTGIPFNVTCPANGIHNVVLTALDSFENSADFALTCKPGFDVGAWALTNDERLRPAQTSVVAIRIGDYAFFWNQQYCNTSNVSGQVVITINGPASFAGAANGAFTPVVTGNTLTYTVNDWSVVNPENDFAFLLHTDTSAQIGQQVCFSVSVTPTAGDNNTINNTLTHCIRVVGSYDPNDKLVSPVGEIDTAQEWLTYTVNFQNTGNAEAIHIYITDTLDANVQEGSFQLLAYSHQPMVHIKGKALRFNFANINLPDSNTNEAASHGYVQYKVKLKENLPIGTTINNTAYIYFDFNAPVVTNTTTNTLVLPTGVVPLQKPLTFSLYPNPTTNVVTIVSDAPLAGSTAFVTDLQGRILITAQLTSAHTVLNTSGYSAGVYMVTVAGPDGNNIMRRLILE